MRSKIKYCIAGMVLGIAFGGLLLLLLYKNPPEKIGKDDSKEILDFIIDSWTNPGVDTIHIAGLGNKRGIFQIGIIPDTVRSLAALGDLLYGIPKGVTCAQWILESKWGLCNLGAENYFGLTLAAVKIYLPNPRFVIRQDTRYVNGIAIREHVRFARFKNIAECFLVHDRYIVGSKLYENAFLYSDQPEKFARALAKHYAADPEYGMKLIALMRKYKLE